MTEPDRAEAMARRLDRTARRLGMAEPDRTRFLDAFRAVMAPRRARIREDHHPDYLHPARTALILMDDTRVADPVTLTSALFTETRDPTLLPDPGDLARMAPDAARLAAAVPAMDRPDRLLEELLALPAPGLRVAAAERLDHARHLHLRDRAEWDIWHATTRDACVPAARRVDATLAARLEWWCDMFVRRFLDG
ncbi:MAG: hypothetical protein ACOCUW_01080 [Gemmatimonadota bacterium]